MRKQRRKISVDEWNVAVAKALNLKESVARGDLTDKDLR